MQCLLITKPFRKGAFAHIYESGNIPSQNVQSDFLYSNAYAVGMH